MTMNLQEIKKIPLDCVFITILINTTDHKYSMFYK